MVGKTGKIRRLERADRGRKGIYILPNAFTTGSLFAAFYAIVQATAGNFEHSAVAIIVAAVLDSLDGRVARMTNTVSDFGKEYDSLVDLVAFGLAPALVFYEWGLKDLGKIGWLTAFIYVAATALRLARFNTQENKSNRYFQGLPCPAAAVVAASVLWSLPSRQFGGQAIVWGNLLLFILLSLAMVSSLPYRSFKDLNLKNRVPFVSLLMLVFVFVLISFDPPRVLLLLSAGFLISGPFVWLILRRSGKVDFAADTGDLEDDDDAEGVNEAGVDKI
ncbi:MAG: CDP-diacylglycerol--serine O-phosphatidyltransferase [Proteobacteria bacterium]|jgi:CDP-diacylglycerol--serine O-phosphatidyltransferase|nr:CDP-diacylglycerol--serine O-phosphatidyltransferase [Pseudomonadota bacterium]MDP6136547.1 CDP-diacylglycerol--serine O-phosphatidyltransferase [Arenicellales bacterium]MDP6653611.1 CDP-diacylglycerol--serine O-phosphatidyltransferase [Gammaproteobacteria bacterium]HCF74602.1 CDP-diacylglycerol--serine O-phosphatidyltransferase [Gammaproteobacteria bacterium]HJP10397.1 CDP-diacylglycerol--serine O-phosphatidyltransferase [Arenicellales bacterium]|tara:strand:+ start:6607 stop:7434 length:828 start_codon:yes stop_codon:yes gene_type:complete